MPTYTYKCDDCDYEFDLFHSISDTSEKICPKCDKSANRFYGECAGIGVSRSGLSSSPPPPPAVHSGFG
ncbi:MAG: zinc ribbon domain-containing protein [Candidatus Electryonea clarkiae]|nr:zinc ribbon domain-containing protein [Candidatus Electryonea clarkiae]MDP8285908.1 zinc ribbon domain-containing protein [Candidatus Electryonea clarkiae]